MMAKNLKKEFELLDEGLDKIIRKAERAILKEYSIALKALKAEVADIYEKYGPVTLVDMQKYDRIKKLEKAIEENVNELYKTNRSLINSTLRESYVASAIGTKEIIETNVKKTLRAIAKPIDVTKTINNEMAGLAWTDRLNKRRSDLIFNIGATIKQGLQNGESYNTMARRLNKVVLESTPKGYKGDAVNTLRVARTESTRVISVAQTDTLDRAKKQGVKMMKTWRTMKDERVRGLNPKDRMDHVRMEGVTIDYEKDFVLPDGSKGPAPHQIGNENDINCRCFLEISLV